MVTSDFVKTSCLAPGVEVNDEQAERLATTLNKTVMPFFKDRQTPEIRITKVNGAEYNIEAVISFTGTMD